MFTDTYFPRINGVSMSVNSYAVELAKMGHKVCIVCPEYTEEQKKAFFFDDKANDGIVPFDIVRVPSVSVIFSKEDRSARIDKWRFIKRRMDEFKPDVVHINTEFALGYFGAIYVRRRNIPYVYTFHTNWEDYFENYVHWLPDFSLRKLARGLIKFHLRRADVIIVPTKSIAEIAFKYGTRKDVDILPTGIPEEREKYIPERSEEVLSQLYEEFPGLKGRTILLFVGRITKEKNPEFLYDVIEKVQEKIPSAALLFVGGGPFLEDLKQIAERRGISHSVFFKGYVPKEDVVYFYRMARVFVFPSKTETQGLVTIEAMLSGLPVVAIGEMGTIDVMHGNNGGFMVSDDPAEFSRRVLELLTDEELWHSKSQEARNMAESLKISNLTPALVRRYEKAIGIRHGHLKDTEE